MKQNVLESCVRTHEYVTKFLSFVQSAIQQIVFPFKNFVAHALIHTVSNKILHVATFTSWKIIVPDITNLFCGTKHFQSCVRMRMWHGILKRKCNLLYCGFPSSCNARRHALYKHVRAQLFNSGHSVTTTDSQDFKMPTHTTRQPQNITGVFKELRILTHH